MNLSYMSRSFSLVRSISPGLLVLFLAACIPAAAQLSPVEPDPLARIRDAANSNVQACSATGETLCEQVAPKIIANAQGDSPLAENLRQVAHEIHDTRTPSSEHAVQWAIAAFQAAGLEARVEENVIPLASKSAPQIQQAVIAEIRGREKPEEWVLLGARLNANALIPIQVGCNAALVIEAARDIQLTRIHPRRSIRFVLFVDVDQDMPGSWAYVRAHRDELDRARAAIFFAGGADRINSYMLNGRQDIAAGLRDAMKPIESWKIFHDVFGGSILMGDFDFLLEGVPTIVAHRTQPGEPLKVAPSFSEELDKVDVQELKRSTAIAAVTAFGIAERADPIGPRQSRAEIESSLKAAVMDQQMKTAGLWPLWESGERGRLP
jgi:hypothetical protein